MSASKTTIVSPSVGFFRKFYLLIPIVFAFWRKKGKMLRKMMCAAILLCFVAFLAAPALAIPAPRSKLMRSEFRFETSGFTNVQPMATATVNIRNIRSGDYVYSTVLIIAQVTGTFSTVVYQIDSGTQRPMSRVGSTNRYQAS
jgi:hypothetical protein